MSNEELRIRLENKVKRYDEFIRQVVCPHHEQPYSGECISLFCQKVQQFIIGEEREDTIQRYESALRFIRDSTNPGVTSTIADLVLRGV